MKEKRIIKQENQFISELKKIIGSARKMTYSAINFAQVQQNWLIGQRIVEQEQNGKTRAEYGKHVIEIASKELTAEFGKGFSERNLWLFKKFYTMFPELQISQPLTDQLSIPQTVSAESQRVGNEHVEKLQTVSAELITSKSPATFVVS
ncbi:MAG: DUF1016 N-terminal domain-containing protein [Bacteroidales bacterium]|jgi:hypothetical protein|nr:DUF1016 N-terminal domain-containing protein [Bacteroidales bacterium]